MSAARPPEGAHSPGPARSAVGGPISPARPPEGAHSPSGGPARSAAVGHLGLLPDARTLVDTVARYLEQDLMPTLDGYHRFQTRIAVNVLRIVGRELALAPRHDVEAHARLMTLLGHDGEHEALDAELAACVLDGERALDDPALVDHLRRTLHAALSIDNPKWVSDEAASEPQPPRSSR